MPPEQYWLMLIQTIATAILGGGAIVVAIVSAMISYRNNFGWKPVVFPTWHRFTIGPIGRMESIVFAFDIWNRQKYPIVVRHLSVTFSGTPLSKKPTMNESSPNEAPNDSKTDSYVFSDIQTVAPQTNFEFTITAPFEIDDIHQLNGEVTIVVDYYDPKTNKRDKITASTSYGFALSTPQREDPVQAMIG